LAQRFVDQELSSSERVDFLQRLGRDDRFRRHVLSLEQVTLAAEELPRAALPAGFVRGVLARVERRGSWHQRLADAVWQPRTLRWNALSALAAAAMVVAVSGLTAWIVAGRPAASTAATASSAPTPVLVRLVVLQPSARTVQVAGDFNGWNPSQTSLQQLPSGAWTVTLPLEPGRYKYKFVVDGSTWIDDPFAVEQVDDGFGATNAVLDVREPAEGVL
jgi:hypothetical protein